MDVNTSSRSTQEPEDGQTRPRYSAPAVKLACEILRKLAHDREAQASLSDLAMATGANKTTTLRVLHELEREGFVYRNDTAKTFGLGAYLVTLGSRAAEHSGVLQTALAALRPAAQETGHTCVVVQRDDADFMTFIAREEPGDAMHVSVKVGESFPLTAGSHGKVFLAHLPLEEARQVVGRVGLPSRGRPVTPQQFLDSLPAVRRDGYAVSMEEHLRGISGVSAPIYDIAGDVVLTLSAIGVAAALDAQEAARVGDVLRRRAGAVSRALGWQQESTA